MTDRRAVDYIRTLISGSDGPFMISWSVLSELSELIDRYDTACRHIVDVVHPDAVTS